MTDKLTELIIGAAIEVHRILGPGLLESIYEKAICYELETRGLKVQEQVKIDVKYKDKIIKGQRLDILVEGEVVVELKSLKYYLTSYRNVGILQEHALNRILQDLVQLLQPVSMVVEAEYKERGGLKTKAVARYEKEQ